MVANPEAALSASHTSYVSVNDGEARGLACNRDIPGPEHGQGRHN